MLTVNQILHQGRYRIIAPLGQNAEGENYEAYDNSLEKSVLLKEISVSLNKVTTSAQLETQKLAFADEAKILTQLKHPTLLQIHHYFSEIDRHYLAAEMVGGNSLSEQLDKTEKPFAAAEVASWADQLLNALHYLHTLIPPIIYRELKPQNVKLSSDGKVKLLTFGIVKNTQVKANLLNPANLPYAPLEQIWDELDAASKKVITSSYDEKSEKILEQPADPRSDIYALGATLYHLATAQLPVDALTRSIDILEGKSDPLPTPNQIDSRIPPEISDVLMKSMEIKRENRFSSAVIMRQVLRTAFVRVKEREAAETRKHEEDVLEIPSAEQYPLEQERRIIEQERLKIEAGQKRLEEQRRIVEQEKLKIEAERKQQAELVAQQGREAERLSSGQNSVEIENQVFEKEAEEPREFLAETLKSDEDFAQIIHSVDALSEQSETAIKPEDSTDEFNGLFAEPQKENKIFKRMAAAAVILVVFGGAAFGIWSFMTSKSTESHQTISSSDTTAPALTIEAATVQKVETNAMPSPSASPVAQEISVNPSTVKTKPVAAQSSPTPAKKQIVPPTKTPEKKAVTVDDLISDN